MLGSYLLVISLVGAYPTVEVDQSTAAAAADLEQRSYAAIRKDFSAASKQAALESGEMRAAAVHKLTELLAELEVGSHLPPLERKGLHAQIRTRLQKISGDIANELARARRNSDERQPATVMDVRQEPANAILAQRLPGGRPQAQNARGGGLAPIGGAGQTEIDRGEELVELIQRTIAPSSWDVVGGPGSIIYWRPGQALVVRNRGEVQQQLGGVLGQLRKN